MSIIKGKLSMFCCSFVCGSLLLFNSSIDVQAESEIEGMKEKINEKAIELLSEQVVSEAEINNFLKEVQQVRQDFANYVEILDPADEHKFFEETDTLQTLVGELEIKADSYIVESDNNLISMNTKDKRRVENSVIQKNVEAQLAQTTRWRIGDILYYGIGSKNAVQEKSFTGHTAVLTTTDFHVIEASQTTKGNKVHSWNRTFLWDGATGIKQYKVTDKLGNEASWSEKSHAVGFGNKQYGKPYSIVTTLNDTSKWYCSKLTNAMWASQGYDLRSVPAYTIGGRLAVTPLQITADLNTRLVKNWGSTLPTKL